jgi:hypothetical protein
VFIPYINFYLTGNQKNGYTPKQNPPVYKPRTKNQAIITNDNSGLSIVIFPIIIVIGNVAVLFLFCNNFATAHI